jgi:hypothetical protein
MFLENTRPFPAAHSLSLALAGPPAYRPSLASTSFI